MMIRALSLARTLAFSCDINGMNASRRLQWLTEGITGDRATQNRLYGLVVGTGSRMVGRSKLEKVVRSVGRAYPKIAHAGCDEARQLQDGQCAAWIAES